MVTNFSNTARQRQSQAPVPLQIPPKWASHFAQGASVTRPEHRTPAAGCIALSFPPQFLKNKFTADKPPLRMRRFGSKTCETADPHNSAISACHNTSSVVQQQQVITIARKESDLSGYTETLSWLLCQSVQSGGKDETKLPSQHVVSIHPKAYSGNLAWNRWGQMVKLQVSVIYTFIRKTQFPQLFLHQIPKQYFFCCWTWLFYLEISATMRKLWNTRVKQ